MTGYKMGTTIPTVVDIELDKIKREYRPLIQKLQTIAKKYNLALYYVEMHHVLEERAGKTIKEQHRPCIGFSSYVIEKEAMIELFNAFKYGRYVPEGRFEVWD